MKNENLELKSVYELSPDEMEELYIEEGDELSLFEGDSDYMVTPGTSENYMTPQNWIYFFIWSDKNLVIVSDYSDYDQELLEFCKGQDTSISRSGVNTRSEVGHWEYMDYGNNAWDSFEKNQNLKIAYRGGCGYVYTLFEYVN